MKNSGFSDFTMVRHHISHAAAAFFLSGFDEANVIVIDGRCENESTSLYHGSELSLNLIDSYSINDSLGHLYTYVTSLLGLYTHRGQEGKTMELSAYGSGKILLDKVVHFSDDRYFINRNKMRKLSELANKAPFSDESKELSYAVQKALEEAYLFLAEQCYKKTGLKKFALAGGVALNCNSNGKLIEQTFVEDLFIQPAANDAGAAIGAAMVLQVGHNQCRPELPDSQIYLGPEYSESDTLKALEKSGFQYTLTENPSKLAAQLLNDGLVIGWYQGAMEFGPRALGNRSILANPGSPTTQDKVNLIKKRESWRPFAPSVLAEECGKWFTPDVPSPYMLITRNVLEDKQSLVPGITHVDGTARVQTVIEEDNEKYYKRM